LIGPVFSQPKQLWQATCDREVHEITPFTVKEVLSFLTGFLNVFVKLFLRNEF
jgi:hypothetical protein